MVRAAEVPYTARIKHDGRTHDVELPAMRCGRCEACGELVFNADTDEQITRALRAKLRLLQPNEIRAEREALSLTQAQLADRIGTAQETISRWESGLHIQSRAMDKLLRVFFQFGEVRQALTSDVASVWGSDFTTSTTGIAAAWTRAQESLVWTEWPELEPEFQPPENPQQRLAA